MTDSVSTSQLKAQFFWSQRGRFQQMPGEIWFDTSDKNMTETTGGSGERVFGWCKEMADSREAQMIIKCKFLNLHQSMQIA